MPAIKLPHILCVVFLFPIVVFSQPLVTTLPPDSVGTTTVLLHGQFDNTRISARSVCFDLGWTDEYEVYIQGICFRPTMTVHGNITDVLFPVSWLLSGTTWHWQMVGEDTTTGNLCWGDDIVFQTLNDTNAGGFVIDMTLTAETGTRWARFGVHTEATYCVDIGLGEVQMPPREPFVFDLRFLDPHGYFPQCMGEGLWYDIRQYVSPTQVDTYEVALTPITYPAVLSWSQLANQYSGAVRLIDVYGGLFVNLDMKAQTSLTITSNRMTDMYIIAEGPMNLVTVGIESLVGDDVSLSGKFNPNGIETYSWFEWGDTLTYGDSTLPKSIGSGTAPVGFLDTLKNLQAGKLYHYRAVTENALGRNYGIDQWFEVSSLTSVAKVPTISSRFKLDQNYPNPFNPSSTITYFLPQKSFVTLKLYDLLGREVRTLVNAEQEPGNYTRMVDANNLPSGVYFYRMQAGKFSDVKKMLMLK